MTGGGTICGPLTSPLPYKEYCVPHPKTAQTKIGLTDELGQHADAFGILCMTSLRFTLQVCGALVKSMGEETLIEW